MTGRYGGDCTAIEWVFLALAAAALYGVSQAVGKYVIDQLSAPMMVFVNFVVSMPMYIAFLVLFIVGSSSLSIAPEFIIYGLVAALLGRAGYYTYLEAVERGPVMLVGSITAAYPAIITVLAITFLHESVSPVQAFGVAVIIGGMVGLSLSHGGTDGKPRLSRYSLIFSLITLVIWGIWGVFAKKALEVIPIIYYIGLYSLVLPPLFLIYARHKRSSGVKVVPKWSRPVKIAVASAVIGQIGLLSDTSAVSIGEAAVVFPLIASYPIITILIAYGFLRERLSRKDMALVAIVVAGIVLVSTV